MRLWLLFFVTLVCADDAFITPREYAVQLYHNPRGIGCHLCHGEKGEGRIIARYEERGEPMRFEAPPINTVDFERFEKALEGRTKGMPRYFLTDDERRALYRYLHPETEKETDAAE